jgi:membrane protease subunit HflK
MTDDKDGVKKGPWGSRSGDGKGQKPKTPWDQGPANEDAPDLEEMLRQAQDKFGSFLGPKKFGSDKRGFGIAAFLLLVVWLGTGFYRVLPEENAVLLTFGKWTMTRSEAGLGYHIPWPIQTVMKVNVAFDRRLEIGFREQSSSRREADNSYLSESQMLTGDENIVDINFVVMWRVGNAKDFLFEIRDPETTVRKVSESAMREIIGRSEIQKALTEGRADIEARTKELIQKMLDDYHSGISINSVQLLSVDPPAPVVDAFDDVQRARSDRERTKNEAETYRNDIVPRARGDAQKLVKDAEAYKEAVISKAKGEADRFISVYTAYALAKDVTSKRLYIETMQKIMESSKKVIVGNGGSAPVMPYMSLDQLQNRQKQPPQPAAQ